jgi:hypothetical protein
MCLQSSITSMNTGVSVFSIIGMDRRVCTACIVGIDTGVCVASIRDTDRCLCTSVICMCRYVYIASAIGMVGGAKKPVL